MAIWIEKSDMLELLNGLHYTATAARDRRIPQTVLDDQFNLIKEAVSAWEDGENKKPLKG
jgi:hypothetical protein